jgi:DNA repair protein SbcD/Mre11
MGRNCSLFPTTGQTTVMRILHTSDWHIGRQFHNVSLLEDQRHVLNQITDLISEQQVDVVLVAGDIYDRSVPPANAVELLDEVINRICKELNVPMIMIAGNHDGPERLGFASGLTAGSGLHIVGPLLGQQTPTILSDAAGDVAFYGIPYADPVTVRDVFAVEAATHDEAMAHLVAQVHKHNGSERRCVVLSHCFLDGGEESESERPLSIGGADRVSPKHFMDFSYVALGHLHGRQFKGAQHIRYSGSILKYSFSEEKHHKSVTLIDLDAEGQCNIEQIELKVLRDMRVLEGALDELLEQGKNDPNNEDYLLVRLTDIHAILDIMGKLRAVYPNVLHLERPGLMSTGEKRVMLREQLKKGEMEMFGDFFQQISGEALSAEQSKIIEETLTVIHKGDSHRGSE